jgi:glutamine synthetase
MADNIMTLRLVVRKIALDAGVWATFMPKPLNGVQGSGMHTHLSLFRGEQNVFYDPDEEGGLSATARSFIAGLLVHACEMTAITNQLVNSYKRLNEGYEAPQYVSWARNNQSALVRVPVPKRGKAASTRIEYRAIDSATNPYLAYSVLLAAGLKGIEEGYPLPLEAKGNLYEMSAAARSDLGIRPLPDSLDNALVEMERSELVRETVGEHIFEWFLRNRRAEWREYQRQVTQFELNRYLPIW